MSRYIDAESYEQYLEEKIKFWRQREEEAHDQSMFEARRLHNAFFYAKVQLKRIPTADVEKVRHGEWKRCGRLEGKTVLKCSICEQGITSMFAPEYHFCPNCGAKMDGENDERGREAEKEAKSNV